MQARASCAARPHGLLLKLLPAQPPAPLAYPQKVEIRLKPFDRIRALPQAGAALMLGLVLASCGPAPMPPATPYDPYEAQNRKVHAFNKSVDTAFLKPASGGAGAVPEPVMQGLSNVAGNLDLPGDIVNSALQGRVEPLVQNTFRFVLNSTIGIGGLFDPAGALGIPAAPTDFGQTLHVWGVGEGAYQELPLLGPSTERDTAGRVVDMAIDPVSLALGWPKSGYVALLKFGSRLGDRSRYSQTWDSTLYESADSYAQTRLMYLENRHYQLGQSASESDAYDPYEDPYVE